MRLKSMILIILFMFSFTAVAREESKRWSLLLDNKPAEAVDLLHTQGLTDLYAELGEAEGIYQAQLMLNQFEQAYNTLKNMTELAIGNSLQALFLIRLGYEAERSGKLADYYELLNKLGVEQRDKVDSYTSTVIAIIRNRELLNKSDYENAAVELAKSSRITKVSRIVGPVYLPQKYGTGLKTPLEDNLATNNYPEYKDLLVSPYGSIDLSNILSSDSKKGVGYIYLTLDSAVSQQAVLDLVSNYICNVWVNGYLVSSADLYRDGYIAARGSRRINLDKGKNLILIKAERNDTLYLGLRNNVTGGKLTGCNILPYNRVDWEKLELKKISGRVFSEKYVPEFIKRLQDDNSAAATVWKVFYYNYTRDYKNALFLIDKFTAAYPSSAFVLFTAGDFYQNYFNAYESKERIRIECENYIRKCLFIKSDYKLAEFILARLLIVTKQNNLVLKILKEIVQDSPRLPFVYKMLADSYAAKGWYDLAEINIQKYYAYLPEKLSKVIAYYLDIEEYEKVEKLLELQAEHKVLNKFDLYKIYVKLQKFTEAEIILKEWYKEYPLEENKYLSEIVDLKYKQGKYDEVEKYLLEKLEKNPNFPGVLKALGVNCMRLGKKDESISWMEKAVEKGIEYAPSLLLLKERIAADSKQGFALKDYDIALEEIDTAEIKKDKGERVSYANILRVKVLDVFEDLSSVMYKHNAFKVFDHQGVSDLAELNVGSGEVLSCRTVNPDGKEYIPESKENLALDKAISMYKVGIDSVLDYSIRSTADKRRILEDGFSFADFDNPVIRSRYVLILPEKMQNRISIVQSERSPDPEITIVDGKVILVWNSAEMKGVEPENYMPEDLSVLPNVRVKIYSSELQMPDLVSGSIPILSNDKIRDTAEKLFEGLPNIRVKVEAVYKWIAENIKPDNKINSARGAFTLKSGSIKARVLLMQAMLDVAGIKAYPALCNVGFSVAGALSAKERVESAAEFSWPMLLRVENDNNKPDIWVQVSNDMRNSSMNNIGKFSLGALALERSQFGQRLGVVYQDLLEGMNVLDEKINIAADGSAVVEGGVEFYGESAARIRQVFYNSESLRQYLAQISSQLFPRITNVDYTYPKLSDIEEHTGEQSDTLRIGCKGTIYKYCNNKGAGLYLDLFDEDQFVSGLLVKEPRKHAIDIRMDIKNVLSKEYIIPEGYAFSNVPEDRVVNSSFGFFILDYTVDKRRLKVSMSILIPHQLILPQDAKIYNEFLAEIKNAAGQGVEISKLSYNYGVEVLSEGVLQPETEGRFMIKEIPAKLRDIIQGEEN